MRPRLTLALSLSLLLFLPALAPAKGINGPVRVSWNGAPPADTRVGGTWDARFTLLQGPGGYYPERPVHPFVVVTDSATGAVRRIAATPDGATNAFKASVPFPHAGSFVVAAAKIDPRRPNRLGTWGPVHIGPAPSIGSSGGTTNWPWIAGVLAAIGALGAALGLRRRQRPRPAGA
jgi:hypothetical protein